MSDIAVSTISIPGSDGLVVSYGGVVLFSVTVENASAPSADLVFYDNTTGSGLIVGVVPATGPNQTYFIKSKFYKSLYVTGTTGWTGSIGFGE